MGIASGPVQRNMKANQKMRWTAAKFESRTCSLSFICAWICDGKPNDCRSTRSILTRFSAVQLLPFPRAPQNRGWHFVSNNALPEMLQTKARSLGSLYKVPKRLLWRGTTLIRTQMLLRRNKLSPETIRTHDVGLHVKYQLFLLDFSRIWIF